ncbi:MAG TPA: glycosyltransferase, partial [Gemmatimonadaceae bacterium]|nr:glycosyltransferase [Gemmatimonadaceae bacterium]
LRDKGVTELVEAARLLRARGVACRVVLRGEPDPGNPTSVTPGEIASWTTEGIVEMPGHSDDMALEMSRATIVALPSYREGLPKALLEAASMGRPIVTTDVPGCREVVHDGVNGLLVPPRDPAALACALEQLLADEAMRARMGEAGRALVLREFSVGRIAGETVRLYEDLCAQDLHAR